MLYKLNFIYFSYLFDRSFYNQSGLPDTLQMPQYFEIKVNWKILCIFHIHCDLNINKKTS